MNEYINGWMNEKTKWMNKMNRQMYYKMNEWNNK